MTCFYECASFTFQMADSIQNASEALSTFIASKLTALRHVSTLTSSAATNKSQIVEAGDLIFHYGGSVAEFSCKILVVTRSNRDKNPIWNIAECYNFEGDRQSLVTSPMRW